MPCRTVHTSHGLAIACSRGFSRQRTPLRCVVCNVPDTMATLKLCDGPGLRAGTTCDLPVCVEHAAHVGEDTDYCPRHAALAGEVSSP